MAVTLSSAVTSTSNKRRRLDRDPCDKFGNLPLNLLAVAFGFLNVREVLKCACVSRNWKGGVRPWAQSTLVLDFPQISWAKEEVATGLRSLFNRCSFSNARDLRMDLVCYPKGPYRYFDWVKQRNGWAFSHQLDPYEADHYKPDDDFDEFDEHLRDLLSERSQVFAGLIQEIGKKLPKATRLALGVKKYQFHDEPIVFFATAMPKIEVLDLRGSDLTSYNSEFSSLGKHFPMINALRLGRITQCSTEDLKYLLLPFVVEIEIALSGAGSSWGDVVKFLDEHCSKPGNKLTHVILTIEKSALNPPFDQMLHLFENKHAPRVRLQKRVP